MESQFENVINYVLKRMYATDDDGKFILDKRIKSRRKTYAVKGKTDVLPFFPANNENDGDDCVISFNIHPTFVNNHEHGHDFFELMMMHAGTCRQIVEGNEILMEEGDICLINMQTIHKVEISSRSDILVNLLISPRILERCFTNMIYDANFITEFIVRSLYFKNQSEPFILFKKSAETQQLVRQVREMIVEMNSKEEFYNKILENQLSILFSYMVRAYRSQISDKSKPHRERFELSEVLEYINEHYSNVTLNELAERFHYNKSYLSLRIKKYTGHSFSTLINEYKLKKATSLLLNSSMSIDGICEVVGFYDHSHFNKVFKERYNMNPSAYREANK